MLRAQMNDRRYSTHKSWLYTTFSPNSSRPTFDETEFESKSRDSTCYPKNFPLISTMKPSTSGPNPPLKCLTGSRRSGFPSTLPRLIFCMSMPSFQTEMKRFVMFGEQYRNANNGYVLENDRPGNAVISPQKDCAERSPAST